MKRKNHFVYALLIGCVLLTGCGSTTNTTTSGEDTVISDSQASTSLDEETVTQSTESTTEQLASSTITGIIESMDDSSITVMTMNRPDDKAPQGNTPNGKAPDGKAPNGETSDGEAPNGEAPDGEMPTGKAPNGETPDGEMPTGEAPDGKAPNGKTPDGEMSKDKPSEMPSNSETLTVTLTDSTIITDESNNEISLDSLSTGIMVTIETDEAGNALTIHISNAPDDKSAKGTANGGPGAAQSAPSSYESVITYTQDTSSSDENYNSTGTDENAILVQNQATVSLDSVTIDRTSSDSTGGDASSFYGIGAAVLVTDGTLDLTNSTVTTDAAGGAGIFAYGNGVVNVSDTSITTAQDTSGGIHVAGGGTLNASNLTIETNGESAAAIRSDRGGGTMYIAKGSYTSNGSGSPAVYCTADITVEDATLCATGSEAVCIEGLNSLKLTDCDLSGNMADLEQNDCTWTVILYQSMSGDSEVGNSTFSMEGGSLTSENGGLFYTTNTESTFYLSNVEITTSKDCDFFLKCTGNQNQRGWGQKGANGANCTFTADNQIMKGDILWDSISTLDFTLSNNSTLTGAFIQDESSVDTTGNGYANLILDKSSTWIVTQDSTLTNLTSKGTIQDANGKTVTIQDTNGKTLVAGDSPYTITVDSYQN